jgi:hypothetical protein
MARTGTRRPAVAAEVVRCGRGHGNDWERDMSDATDLVDRQIAAYRDRDLNGFLSCYAADVKIRDFAGHVLMDGLEDVRGRYGPLFRDSPELAVEIPRRMVTGDHVIDEEEISGFVMAGSPATIHAVVVYQVRDGLIQEVMLLM